MNNRRAHNSLGLRATLILVLSAVASLFVAIRSLDYSISELPFHNDFAHYSITSLRLLDQVDPYSTDLTDSYHQHNFLNLPKIDRATNPPALAFIFIPFAVATPLHGYIAWNSLQLLALIFSVIALLKILELNFSKLETTALVFAAFSMCPSISHLQYAQSQMLILLLVVWGIKCAQNSNFEGGVGWFLWGIATALKLFTWPLIGVAWLYGGVRGVVYFLVGVITLQIPAALLVGPEIIISHLHYAVPYINSVLASYNSNNSLVGALSYTIQLLGGNYSYFLPLNIVRIVSAGPILLIPASKIFGLSADKEKFLKVTAIVLLSAILFSPTSWNHYFVLAIVALLVLLKECSLKIHPAKNLVSLLIAYLMVALTQGRLHGQGVVWELTTAWLGCFAILYLGGLLVLEEKKENSCASEGVSAAAASSLGLGTGGSD